MPFPMEIEKRPFGSATPHLATVHCGMLSNVYLRRSRLGTYTTGWDTITFSASDSQECLIN